MAQKVPDRASARRRLLEAAGVFEVQGLAFTEPDFRGCAFVSAKGTAGISTSPRPGMPRRETPLDPVRPSRPEFVRPET